MIPALYLTGIIHLISFWLAFVTRVTPGSQGLCPVSEFLPCHELAYLGKVSQRIAAVQNVVATSFPSPGPLNNPKFVIFFSPADTLPRVFLIKYSIKMKP